jgi:importin subunit alpha-6/7
MSLRAGAGGRQESYKNKALFKQDELRRRREEAQVEIRKQKREESMAKRRNLYLSAADLTDGETDDEEAVGASLDNQVSTRGQV